MKYSCDVQVVSEKCLKDYRPKRKRRWSQRESREDDSVCLLTKNVIIDVSFHPSYPSYHLCEGC